MPTQHVEPASDDLLQQIADSLLKARKVVVVTGAGISTNSGIPDFRSENGLYSLIQAQFDAAARQARPVESADSDKDEASFQEPPAKRRRLSPDSSESRPFPNLSSTDVKREPPSEESQDDSEACADGTVVNSNHEANEEVDGTSPPSPNAQLLSTPQPKFKHPSPTTSPLSSPPPEDFILTPRGFQDSTRSRLYKTTIPLSSSPLSSPPPGLFDPYPPSSPSDSSTTQNSTSPSELDDSPPSSNNFSSQSSTKSTLPNMKGKDLFDASIWSDPLRTSVFYTFATTLRQKVKEVTPTPSHHFISHLRDRGKLVRCYTQNIDQIEEKVGLSTCLTAGPGSRGRFSRRSTANTSQLNKMVEEASDSSKSQTDASQSQDTEDSQPKTNSEGDTTEQEKHEPPAIKREPSRTGVECVFLHGSLEQLRCFLCGRVCSWDEAGRQEETLSGQQPECPHCAGATARREERGKRALGVGKLRPDIVLYGEDHPNSHLISPIVTHDLALQPDMLLILGTSLRVHGLKVMVREFAKAVHNRAGKVVFVNFTKPPESAWGDIIDYWIQWDCDAWVDNLQGRIPKLWQALEPPKPKKKRDSAGKSDIETKKPPAANPVAQRDTKATGAYWSLKIINELHRITGTPPLPSQPRRASLPTTETTSEPRPQPPKAERTKPKRPRKSAPGALEKQQKPSTLNPNHGRPRRQQDTADSVPATPVVKKELPSIPISSILDSVKSNPRVRKRKMIDGEEVVMPKIGRRRTANSTPAPTFPPPLPELKLAPLNPQPASPSSPYGRPEPLEPQSPPPGPPLASISANPRNWLHDAFAMTGSPIQWPEHPMTARPLRLLPAQEEDKSQAAARALAELRDSWNVRRPPQDQRASMPINVKAM